MYLKLHPSQYSLQKLEQFGGKSSLVYGFVCGRVK